LFQESAYREAALTKPLKDRSSTGAFFKDLSEALDEFWP